MLWGIQLSIELIENYWQITSEADYAGTTYLSYHSKKWPLDPAF
jgi:hypothetical protein